jgi:hypothetical protein
VSDPFTLAAAGSAVLTEGIKFLYAQAGEALKAWRARKAKGGPAAAEPIDVQLPSSAFSGELARSRLDLDAVGRLEQDLRDLRAAVADYAQGIDEVDENDGELLQVVDTLRRAMEAVYGQRITFKGEQDQASGPLAAGEANVDDVLGYAAGLRAKALIGGSAIGIVKAKRVESGAEVIGLDIGTIGRER